MTSSARTKSRPRKTTTKLQNVTGVRILVEDLVVGDRIVTSWRSSSTVELTDTEVAEVLLGEKEMSERYVNSSKEVKKFSECPTLWRTHVHVNDSDCYDMRTYVWVVNG